MQKKIFENKNNPNRKFLDVLLNQLQDEWLVNLLVGSLLCRGKMREKKKKFSLSKVDRQS